MLTIDTTKYRHERYEKVTKNEKKKIDEKNHM